MAIKKIIFDDNSEEEFTPTFPEDFEEWNPLRKSWHLRHQRSKWEQNKIFHHLATLADKAATIAIECEVNTSELIFGGGQTYAGVAGILQQLGIKATTWRPKIRGFQPEKERRNCMVSIQLEHGPRWSKRSKIRVFNRSKSEETV